MNYDVISWETIDEAIDIISEKIKLANIHYRAIYGIPRGGLVPAVMLSHRLGISLIVDIEDIDKLEFERKDVLIVDDISDSGDTLSHFNEEGFDSATLYTRVHTTKTISKYNALEVNHDDWLVFPWEAKNSSC